LPTCIRYNCPLATASTGTWEFLADSVRSAFVHTPKDYGYNYFWLAGLTSHHVIVSVKAAGDAHIAVSEVAGDVAVAYEIVIGGWSNTRSAIRDIAMQEPKVQVDTPGMLSASEFRTFWIRWAGGHVEVGQGHDVGNNRFMNWQQTNAVYNITAVGVSTGS
jgi:hypothetical protein